MLCVLLFSWEFFWLGRRWMSSCCVLILLFLSLNLNGSGLLLVGSFNGILVLISNLFLFLLGFVKSLSCVDFFLYLFVWIIFLSENLLWWNICCGVWSLMMWILEGGVGLFKLIGKIWILFFMVVCVVFLIFVLEVCWLLVKISSFVIGWFCLCWMVLVIVFLRCVLLLFVMSLLCRFFYDGGVWLEFLFLDEEVFELVWDWGLLVDLLLLRRIGWNLLSLKMICILEFVVWRLLIVSNLLFLVISKMLSKSEIEIDEELCMVGWVIMNV